MVSGYTILDIKENASYAGLVSKTCYRAKRGGMLTWKAEASLHMALAHCAVFFFTLLFTLMRQLLP